VKIALISPSPPDLYAPGLRTISSYLKKNGHETRLILLAGGTEKLNFSGQFVYQFRDHVIDQIIELSGDVDLIGISFMTQYFDRAVQLTQKIKEATKVPVIWGGIHPTLCPEECIEYADIVCIGEGELALHELMNKMQNGQDYFDTKSFWFKKDREIIRNEVRPLLENLDELPFQDYDFEDQYVYDLLKDSIVPLTEDMFEGLFSLAPDLKGRMVPSYKVMTTRGCPMNCTFCASSFLKKKLYSHNYVRHRSVDNVIRELEGVIKKFPSIKLIQIFDDILFYLKEDFIRELATAYKERISLPFYCQASATTMNEEKLKHLLNAGLIWVEIGIQSGSEKTNRIYKRNVSNEKLLRSASVLHKYSKEMLPPCYHVILDNPWETAEDILKTLNVIMKLPTPYSLKLASLVFFPKTGIYDKAKAEGLIKNDLEEIYRKPFVYVSGNYLNYLVYLAGYPYFPRWILKALSHPVMVKIFYRDKFASLFRRLYYLTESLRKVGRGFQALLRGEFRRIYSGVQLRLRTSSKV
jgi:radical SAM superfamily enzyme YgiQ (UPF0313 family)